MESDTPRTDAEWPNLWVVPVGFAKQLERELAAAIKERDEARIGLCEFYARMGGVYHFINREVVECTTPESVAEVCGWDCFAKKEGGGA